MVCWRMCGYNGVELNYIIIGVDICMARIPVSFAKINLKAELIFELKKSAKSSLMIAMI